MDKITRILLLYSKLMQGEKINKLAFCLETDSQPRSFDRDIEDIRLYLLDAFANEELVYDRQDNSYYLSGTHRKELETTEFLFLQRVILDTGILRTDELNGLLSHLLANTERAGSLTSLHEDILSRYSEPIHSKALLKMHEDLSFTIKQNSVIIVSYNKMDGSIVERELLPCLLKYDLGYLYLVAFRTDTNDKYPAYFRLDRIYSFSIMREQRTPEKEKVKEYIKKYSDDITQMYGGDYTEILISCVKDFFPYVHDKFKNAEIVEAQTDVLIVRLWAFDNGFIKWLLSQPTELIKVVEPGSLTNKIAETAKKILNSYTEV